MGAAARARLVVMALIAVCGCDRVRTSGPLTTIVDVRRLSPEEAQLGRPVRLRGVVTGSDPSLHRIVLHDGTGGISVDASDLMDPLWQGQAVEVAGFTGRGERFPVVTRPEMKLLPDGRLPHPRSVSLGELASGEHDEDWVEARAVVRSVAVRHDGTLSLDLGAGGVPFTARVIDSTGIVFSSIVDATVAVRGVPTSILDARREVVRVELLVAGRDQLTVVEPVPADPFAVAPVAIASLPAQPPRDRDGHRVRVRGTLTGEDLLDDWRVEDPSGAIRVRPVHRTSLGLGAGVDVLGFPARDAQGVLLEHATVRPASAGPSPVDPDRSPSPRPRLMTSAAAIRNLGPAEAGEGRPVRLRAVVTYYDPGWTILFVQDATAGVFVDVNGLPSLPLRAGDAVEVEGLTDPGDFAPQVVQPKLRVLGRGTLPAPLDASADKLFTGGLDSQWVEAEGIVQATRQAEDRLWVDVVAGLYRFSLHTPGVWGADRLRRLIDARVRVRGACGTLFNARRQLVGVQIYAPDLGFLTVLEEGGLDPSSLPLLPAASLLQFDRSSSGRRLRVRGVATAVRPGGLFVQDPTGGLLVRTAEQVRVRPGDQVEAVGFAAPGGSGPVLRDAAVTRLAAGSEPEPTPVTAAEAAGGNHDAHLVRLDAYLLERVRTSREHVLSLQAGRFVFDAHLPDAGDPVPDLRPGSLLRLTGVCSVIAESSGSGLTPRSFEVLLRSPRDVAVLQAPPWWTVRHTLWAVVLLAGVVVSAVAWAVTLRRRVRAQTALIERSHRELVNAEKMASLGRLTAGIAHEMNTPLATVRGALFEIQNLNAEYGAAIGDESVTPADHREISAEMQRAIALADKAAEKAAGFVRGIKSQTRDTGRDEGVRFDPVPVVQEALWLMGHAVRQGNCTVELEPGTGPVELKGVPGRLAQVVTNLVANALDASRQRGGGRIRLELCGNGTRVHLRVKDEGCGIPPENLARVFEPMFTSKPFGEGTGLGLSIVHDIVTGHFGGEIHVQSEVGKGTTVDVALPRAEAAPGRGAKVPA